MSSPLVLQAGAVYLQLETAGQQVLSTGHTLAELYARVPPGEEVGVVGGPLLPRRGPLGMTLRELGVRDDAIVRVVSPPLRWSDALISSIILGSSFVIGCMLLAGVLGGAISSQMGPAARSVASDSLVPAARAVASDSLGHGLAFLWTATWFLRVAGLGLAAPVAMPIFQSLPGWIGAAYDWLTSFWR